MPIPPFDANLVTPPTLGNHAANWADLSPYPCDTLELCQRFATSHERIAILDGLLTLREHLAIGSLSGFQWVGGSFTENIEAREKRPPGDVDVVTLYRATAPGTDAAAMVTANPALNDHDQTKLLYRVDHVWVDITYSPDVTVEYVRCWLGLFTHRRDNVWKGMLRLELGTPAVDANARAHLAIARVALP